MLNETAKKRKNFIVVAIISFVLLSLAFVIFNSFTKVKKERLHTERESQKITQKDVSLIPENAFNETWALSMENSIEKQNGMITKFIVETRDSIKTLSTDLNKSINESTNAMKESQESFEKSINENMNEAISSLQNQINIQNEKIEEIVSTPQNKIRDNILPEPSLNIDDISELNTTDSNNSKTGDSQLASILDEEKSIKKNINIVKPVKKIKKRAKMVSLDVEYNEELISEEDETLEKIQSSLEKVSRSFHVSTGIAKAFLLTGAYAPAFSSGDEGSLPILIEVNGDIIQANNEIGNLDKCFLTGAATGDMTTQTAKIRIQSVSCVLNGGKQIIEGPLSGWVVGNNGLPNIHGDLLHKNGAWMSRTFLAGFLQTASTALSGITTVQNVNNSVDTTTLATDTLSSAAAGGASTIFEKLGEYYLKMAEKIFPVIEVKAGQEVSIYLLGGEDLVVKDAQTASLSTVEDVLKKEAILRNKESLLTTVKTDKITSSVTKTKTGAPALPKLPTIGGK